MKKELGNVTVVEFLDSIFSPVKQVEKKVKKTAVLLKVDHVEGPVSTPQPPPYP